MRQTLFYIPHEIAGLPVFGLGWLLTVWCLASLGYYGWKLTHGGWTREARENLPIVLLSGVAIIWVLPWLEVQPAEGPPLGLPIRGYGTFVLAGVLAGIGLSAERARRVGIAPDVIYSLAMWVMVAAILGARTFFVIQNWSSFVGDTVLATVSAILRFTEGGLVVYGAFLGAMAATILFARRHRLPVLKLADLIAPGMVLGLAFGRIGCLLNGCCYGGVCEDLPWAVTFPRFASVQLRTLSPPYEHQLVRGELHGLRLKSGPGGDFAGFVVVASVRPGSAADRAGVKAEVGIARLNGRPIETLADAQRVLFKAGPDVVLESTAGRRYSWTVGALPNRSRPVHPTQIYSTINAALLCWLLCAAAPALPRQGQLFALLLTLYPISRFILEAIRDDEGGQFGTSLTISQWLSLLLLAAAGVLWVTCRRPHKRSVR